MAKDRITVLPRDDGKNFQNSWMVHKNGQMKSNHTTKQAAKNKAREYASDGDTLEIRRQDGTVQKRVTVRSAYATESDGGGRTISSPYGAGVLDAALPDRL